MDGRTSGGVWTGFTRYGVSCARTATLIGQSIPISHDTIARQLVRSVTAPPINHTRYRAQVLEASQVDSAQPSSFQRCLRTAPLPGPPRQTFRLSTFAHGLCAR